MVMNTPARWIIAYALLYAGPMVSARADWPTLHGDAARTGYTPTALPDRLQMRWIRSFEHCPIGTAVEPIVAGGRVFVPTTAGRVFALDAATGEVLWRFAAAGPVLHSVAWDNQRVYAASVDGWLYCLAEDTGEMLWRFDAGRGGFGASPAVVDGVVYIGSRGGMFYALRDVGASVALLWQRDLGAPIWQTAAVADGRAYVMAEDMVARCFDARTGGQIWQAGPVGGSSARDYYPSVLGDYVVFRTRPADGAEQMTDYANRTLAGANGLGEYVSLDQNAEIFQANQQPIAQERIDTESAGVRDALAERPTHKTFHTFEAATGEPTPATMLWTGGCGGVPAPPAQLADGRVVTLWRSLWTGWVKAGDYNLQGYSPHHGWGVIDLATGRMTRTPLNTPGDFGWGLFPIADEHIAAQVAGPEVVLTHQGSIAAFDPDTGRLRVLFSGRDGWGVRRCLPWVGNEWHGPARGGLAITDDGAFWVVGGRVIAFGPDRPAEPVEDAIDPAELHPPLQPARPMSREQLTALLAEHIQAYLDHAPYAPLRVPIGKGGVVRVFDQSADELLALAEAYPLLPGALQQRVREHALALLAEHPPWDPRRCFYDPAEGEPRERWQRPANMTGQPRPALEIGGVWAAYRAAEAMDAYDQIESSWPGLAGSLTGPMLRGFAIDPTGGHRAMNDVLAGLDGYVGLAERFGDAEALGRARDVRAQVEGDWLAWWTDRQTQPERKYFAGVTVAEGDVLWAYAFSTPRPHVAHTSSFACLTPFTQPLVDRLTGGDQTQAQLDRLLDAIAHAGPSWYVSGSERWLHRGENHSALPDETPGILRALSATGRGDADRLAQYADRPMCPGDWFYVRRLVAAIDAR